PGVEAGGLMLARRLTPIALPADPARGVPSAEVTVYDGRLGSGVELLVLDAPGLFDRPGIYGEAGVGYEDNDRRFGLFCRAIAESVRQRAASGSPLDVVHAHDWPAALVAYLLRHGPGARVPTKSVLTIHNLAHQGLFTRDALAYAGLGLEHFDV